MQCWKRKGSWAYVDFSVRRRRICGSHACVELIEAGYDVIVADNLVNASREAVRRVEQITGKAIPFVQADLCDPAAVEEIFE